MYENCRLVISIKRQRELELILHMRDIQHDPRPKSYGLVFLRCHFHDFFLRIYILNLFSSYQMHDGHGQDVVLGSWPDLYINYHFASPHFFHENR